MISELQFDMNMTSKFMRKGELTRAAILDVADCQPGRAGRADYRLAG
jgi:replicative superfamily II helicase